MCGICGVVNLRGPDLGLRPTVEAMCNLIRHRGPDGDGFYHVPHVSLGMRRLSIIDVEGSDQPLYNEDYSIGMVFNGEIYNYREIQPMLEAQGHTLRTAGDGETLIHLYETYGLDMFAHLRGMYAFALWDDKKQRLVLAVDHIGMKPLYLLESGNQLYFSSEVKAFGAVAQYQPALNLETLDTYLSFGYMIGAETTFQGVRRLMPGHVLVAENGAIQEIPYWDFLKGYEKQPMPTLIKAGMSDADILTQTREQLDHSVKLHLRSDVPLGLFLSGGVDSAAMLALMSRVAEGRVKTFTIGYQTKTQDNELAAARRIAQHFQTEHHEHVITADDWWNGFERYVYHHDEPNANPSAISLMLLSEPTAQAVKVVLTGLGGDELFGGYSNHRVIPSIIRAQAQWGWLRGLAGPLGKLESLYPTFKRYRYIGALPTYLPRLRHRLLPLAEGLMRSQSLDGLVFSDHVRDQLYAETLKQAWIKAQHKEKTFAQILAKSTANSPENTAQALVINTWLTGNALLHGDKVTMAHSLEARIPFFDADMMRFAAQVPVDLRMRENKYVLREAMRPLLPEFALERPKQPFSTPILNWFGDELRNRIQATLLDPSARIQTLFQKAPLEKLLRDHFSGQALQVEVVFRLLTLEFWMRRFL